MKLQLKQQKLKRYTFIVALLLSAQTLLVCKQAFAFQTLTLKDHDKVSAIISNREQNRIYINNDRIENVFGSEEMFVPQSDTCLGQLFLKPKTALQGFTITLTTEKGRTIDLY